MSKGSKRRPIDPKIERKVFEDNWDRIFGIKYHESDNALERPYIPATWTHHCAINGIHEVGEGETCNWCGEKEDA